MFAACPCARSHACCFSLLAVTIALLSPAALRAAAPIKLNGTLVAGGDVSLNGLQFSPDGSRVLYLANQTTNTVVEIFSVPSVGGVATKLNGALVANGGIFSSGLQFSPDSSRVLYVADQTTDEVFELFSVPSAGGFATKLNSAIVQGDVSTIGLAFSPDSSRVLFHADQTTDEVFEIYSVPSVGGVAPTKLNGTLVANGDVSSDSIQFSPDGSRVLYHADQTTDQVFEIFSVPAAGGVAPTKLNGTLVANGDVSSLGLQFSPDGSRVLYHADQTTDQVFEIFSVPAAGGVAPTKLNGTLVANGNVSSDSIQFSPDGSRVLYHADQTTDQVFEIFSVPAAGGVATKLNGALVAGGNVSYDGLQFSPDGSRVLYHADQTTDNVGEIFSVPSAGGVATKLNGELVAGGDVSFYGLQFSPDGSRVLYHADQTTDEVYELFSVPSAGGPATKLNGALPAGGNLSLSDLAFSPDGSRVLYLADQSADDVFEIFIVPSAGGVATKLNGALVASGDVTTMQFSPDGSLVLYRADQDTNDVEEIYVRVVGQDSLAGAGNWDAGAAWNHGVAPDNVMQVSVDAPGTVTVSGVGTRTVNELVVGGAAASSTLALASGAAIESLHGMAIKNKGVVRGDGVIVAGPGGLSVATGGEVQAAAGDRLLVSSPSAVASAGRIEAIGNATSPAEIEFDSALTNSAGTGSIVARNAILRFNSGLTNHSAVALSFGTTDVIGDVTNSATGTIAVAGNSGVTFYDDVTNSGTLNAAGGSTAVFFGALAGNGNVGSGSVQALGDLLPGASPGTMSFGGDLTMGPLTHLEIEIAGTGVGQFDRLVVSGSATLAGLLDVELDGFSLLQGQSFEIVDIVGARSGIFSGLAEGATLGNFGGTDLFITYAGGDGNDVVLFAPGVPGDYNNNGTVDAADYVLWRKGGPLTNEVDNPGTVNAADYTAWRARFGNTSSSGAGLSSAEASPSQVPEPNAVALATIACLIGVRQTRRILYR